MHLQAWSPVQMAWSPVQTLTSIGDDVQAMVRPEAQLALPELQAVRVHDNQNGALALVLMPAGKTQHVRYSILKATTSLT